MIVHFIGSKSGIQREINYYRKIADFIKSKGHSLAYDWVEETYKSLGSESQDELYDWAKVDSSNTAGIAHADLVIVEATQKSFFVGYRTAQAIQQKKPTLIMYREDAFPGAKDLSKAGSFVSASEYDDASLEKVLDKFIIENTIDTKDMRFNFFIDRGIYNYLRWAAFKTGKTKAEILRNLVQKEINKKELD